MRIAYSSPSEPLRESRRYLIQNGSIIRRGKVEGAPYYLPGEDEPQALIWADGSLRFLIDDDAQFIIGPENYDEVLKLVTLWGNIRKGFAFFCTVPHGLSNPPKEWYESPGAPLYDEECHKIKNQWCRALLKRGSVPRETIKVHDKRLIISDLNEVAGFYYGTDLGGVVFHLRDGLVAVLERYALAFCYLTEEELRAGNKLPSPDLWTTLRNTNSIPGHQDRCVRLDIEALWYLPELIHLAKNNIQTDNK